VLPALVSVLRPQEAWICVLVKPQFEAGRKEVGKGGVVRDAAVHERVVQEIGQEVQKLGLRVCGSITLPAGRSRRQSGILAGRLV